MSLDSFFILFTTFFGIPAKEVLDLKRPAHTRETAHKGSETRTCKEREPIYVETKNSYMEGVGKSGSFPELGDRRICWPTEKPLLLKPYGLPLFLEKEKKK